MKSRKEIRLVQWLGHLSQNAGDLALNIIKDESFSKKLHHGVDIQPSKKKHKTHKLCTVTHNRLFFIHTKILIANPIILITTLQYNR